jgi:single-stranded-DNA-specific exonuclease
MNRLLIIKVSGVTYEGRQTILANLKGNEPVRIEPEPTNKFDPNALAVKIAMPDGIKHAGYIPREMASQIAPVLDGESLMVSIKEITGGFELGNGELAAYGLRLRVELPQIEDQG